MKNIPLLVLFAVFTSFTFTSSKCSQFQTGQFIYLDKEYSDWQITRDANYQVERSTKDHVTLKAKIQWLSECEYELTYVETSYPRDKAIIGRKLRAQIKSIDGNTYEVEAKSDEHVYKLRMKKVK